MTRRTIKFTVIGTALLSFATALLALADAPTTQPDPNDPVTLEGKPAPDFKATGLDGKDYSLTEFKGNVLIVDFWATWCVPCHAELTHLMELNAKDSSKGLKILAVDGAEDKDAVQKWVTANNLTLPILLDPDSTVNTAYKVDGYPETVIVGKDGVVKKVFTGFTDSRPKEIEGLVDSELAK